MQEKLDPTKPGIKIVQGSEIRFFKNGIDQGVAFRNVYEGTYYPAVSLYMGANVTFNFGPKFKYPPTDLEYYPACYMAPQ